MRSGNSGLHKFQLFDGFFNRNVSGFVLYRLGHISAAVRCTAHQLIHLTDAKFDVEPQLCLPCCKTNGRGRRR